MALFDRLTERVEQRASTIADRSLRMIEAAVAASPGVTVRREGHELVVSGRGLLRRWLGDARLRFAPWAPSTSFAGPPPRAGEDLG